MIDESLVDILACPHTQQDLELADSDCVQKLNDLQKDGKLVNYAKQKVENVIDGVLIQKETRELAYPVINGIPVLLLDEAIELNQINL